MQIARAIVGPHVLARLGAREEPASAPRDRFDVRQVVAEGAGVVAGLASGAAVTAVCAAKYPAAAVAVGTVTALTVLQSPAEEGSPLANGWVKTAAAVGAGVLAGAYAPVVAGAAAAVAVEHLVTRGVLDVLKEPCIMAR